ncbi:MAG: Fe-S protein assembly chaperone HscA [Rhodospirillales bacterium RIFCSPLOWO2_12_FULL_58_28]|nr:MAG: Fe-S protein assembly chaperone HscA [Rhodospirillales bacterium RIFCSPLOWO2_02_FULL_58_16]OHC77422.1 MAG: Fe-S protein assembly chaperone HscA [Rhodospirillales bacterium RIFCSPLOWO2_12_FULL_58_28]
MELLQIHEPGETPLPHEGEKDVAVGIDLGTTNSVVAVSFDGKPEVLRDESGQALVPSVVAYAPDGSAIVGSLARMLLLDRPESVVCSIKRLMGRGIDDVKSLGGSFPFAMEPAIEGESAMIRLNVAGHRLSPVEISADILKALKERSEDYLGAPVKRAVITVPAHFDDAARAATRDAARLAGLEVLRLVSEPTAAALAYGLDKEAEGLFAVYDLGGGTFDISLLHMEKGVFQVIATGGDAALGGDDFDHAVAEHFFGERSGKNGESRLDSSDAKVMLMTARMVKECLTGQAEGEWKIEADGKLTSHHLGRKQLETMIRPLVDRTIAICRGVLEDAGVTAGDIKGVVLVGGSTRVPLVRRCVKNFFGKEPLADINPDEVVAIGAALQAEALTVGSDTLLLDVTSLSLGIETMGGLVEKIIPRNTPIPVAKAQEFTTYQNGQTAMSIHVLQGEREMVGQNRSLARFDLRGIPPMTAGAARIKVTYTVDADGLLTVGAREEMTGVEQTITVKPTYGLSENEMTEMLYAGMKYAKEDMNLRLLAESRVEARRTINAVISAVDVDRDLLDEEEIRHIRQAVETLSKAISGDDRDAIMIRAEELEAITKPFAEKRMDRSIRNALKGVSVDKL